MTKINKIFLLLMSLLFLIILPCVMADSEQYLMGGVSRDSSYDQDGTGLWAGRAGTPVTRTLTSALSTYPIIGDVDNDDRNEIIFIDNGNLIIANYTSSVGILIEQTVTNFGDCKISTTQFYPTPSLYDYDSDGTYEIITSNISHFSMYSYNGTQIVLNQSAATQINMTAVANPGNIYPVIKCAPGAQWSSGNITCVMPIANRSASTGYSSILFYDVNENNVIGAQPSAGLPNSDSTKHNTHLFDGDGDGFLEAYYSFYDAPNGAISIYLAEDVGTSTRIFYYDGANNAPFTDIIVTKLDGSTPSVTFGYSDVTNMFGWTLMAGSPYTNMTTAYCTALNCPEGNQLSANMWIDDGTYGDYSGDVCYYVRNYANNDPGVNIDTVHCLSQYAGAQTEETTITNSNKNFTSQPIIHESKLTGSQGLLTPEFLLQGNVKESIPSYSMGNAICVPVDYEESGSLDFICMNSTVLKIFDDGYTNQNTQINTIAPDTGNPICSGETLTTTLTIADNESDAGNCYIRVVYANMTTYGNYSNTSFAEGATSVDLFFTASPNATLNLIHYYECKDQYHTTYTSKAYSVTYSGSVCGSGACNCKGYGTPLPIDTTPTPSAVTDDVFENTWDEFGITSSTSKAIIGLAVVIGVMVSIGTVILSPIAIIAGGIITLIIVTYMGLVSAYILILTLVGLALVYFVLAKTTNSPGV